MHPEALEYILKGKTLPPKIGGLLYRVAFALLLLSGCSKKPDYHQKILDEYAHSEVPSLNKDLQIPPKSLRIDIINATINSNKNQLSILFHIQNNCNDTIRFFQFTPSSFMPINLQLNDSEVTVSLQSSILTGKLIELAPGAHCSQELNFPLSGSQYSLADFTKTKTLVVMAAFAQYVAHNSSETLINTPSTTSNISSISITYYPSIENTFFEIYRGRFKINL